jgi:hypothetical protein
MHLAQVVTNDGGCIPQVRVYTVDQPRKRNPFQRSREQIRTFERIITSRVGAQPVWDRQSGLGELAPRGGLVIDAATRRGNLTAVPILRIDFQVGG